MGKKYYFLGLILAGKLTLFNACNNNPINNNSFPNNSNHAIANYDYSGKNTMIMPAKFMYDGKIDVDGIKLPRVRYFKGEITYDKSGNLKSSPSIIEIYDKSGIDGKIINAFYDLNEDWIANTSFDRVVQLEKDEEVSYYKDFVAVNRNIVDGFNKIQIEYKLSEATQLYKKIYGVIADKL